jgi:pectinesterase
VGSEVIGRRSLLAGAGAALGCAAMPAVAKQRWDAVVSRRRAGAVATLAEALALAERAGGKPFAIRLDEGVYEEKLTIRTPNLTIAGVGPRSIVSFGAAAGHKRPDGNGWGTSGSATLTIEAPGVTLRNLTVRNSFDYIRERETSGGAQAVALAIGRNADRTLIDRCHVEGFQDTLLVQARSSFRGSRISGNVDFIFGGGAALFRNCDIVTRYVPGRPDGGFIAAPSTPEAQPFGFVFSRCRIARQRGIADAGTFLGRPWRAGGNMALLGAAAFLDCWLDSHISPAGWTSMGFRDPGGNARQLQPWEARLFEHGSLGPGAGPAAQARRLLTAAQARAYTPQAVLSGWAG